MVIHSLLFESSGHMICLSLTSFNFHQQGSLRGQAAAPYTWLAVGRTAHVQPPDQHCCDIGSSLQLVTFVSHSVGQSVAESARYDQNDPRSHRRQPRPDQRCREIGSPLQLVSCKSLKIAYYTAVLHSKGGPRQQVETLSEKNFAQLLQQLLESKPCNLCPAIYK